MSNDRCSSREGLAIMVDLDKEFMGRTVHFLERGLNGTVGCVLDFPDTVSGVSRHCGYHIRYPVAPFETTQVINVNVNTLGGDHRSWCLFDDNSTRWLNGRGCHGGSGVS